MSLQEKVSQTSTTMAGLERAPEQALGSAGCTVGIERLGIPTWDESDANLGVTSPSGVRGPEDPATAFPSSVALGATFSPELAGQQGRALAAAARAKGLTVQLAGGMNRIRERRGGRIFEYLSEDVLLSGIMAGASIAGIQSEGVISTLKHFLLAPQETGRVRGGSDLSEKALRESDLLALQIALEHGRPRSIMSACNMLNRKHTSENAFLIAEVLKGDWQFKGFVMADWGSTRSTEHAALADLDRQSGYDIDTEHFFGQPLAEAVEAGRAPVARLDDMVTRILTALPSVDRLGNRRLPSGFPAEELAAVARRVAEQSIVLLKNDDGALPIRDRRQRVV